MTTDFNNQIEIFTTDDGKVSLKVTLTNETTWLSQAQICSFFGRERSVVTKHINNVFKDGELDRESNVQNMHIANSDKPVKFYNLDVIISVGYRVKSQRGIQFRQWATKVLKQHLVQGYTLNQKRLQERGIEFEQVISLLSQTLNNQELISEKGQLVIDVINEYARSWSLLQGYDNQNLVDTTQRQSNMVAFNFVLVLEAVNSLKKELINKGEATELFGQFRGDGLVSSVSTIEQGFGDECSNYR